MKLGILGGTFNPIHNGHLAMAEAVWSAHQLDRVLFVPSARPPHKQHDLTSPEDRLAMVKLAIAGRVGFEASTLELDRPGPSFTVDTLEELKRRYPLGELFFILGEDSISELPGWKDTGRLLELARIVAVNRPGSSASFRARDFPGVSAAVLARLEADRVTMTPCPHESRRLREAVRSGRSVRAEVPASVADYIASHGLYLAG